MCLTHAHLFPFGKGAPLSWMSFVNHPISATFSAGPWNHFTVSVGSREGHGVYPPPSQPVAALFSAAMATVVEGTRSDGSQMDGVGASGSVTGQLRGAGMHRTRLCSSPIDRGTEKEGKGQKPRSIAEAEQLFI